MLRGFPTPISMTETPGHTTPPKSPWFGAVLLLIGCAGFAAAWVLLALWSRQQAGWMALLAAIDAALLLRLGRFPAGSLRIVLAVAATLAMAVLAQWTIVAAHIGAGMGLQPWDSALKLGPDHAWTLLRLANGTGDWLFLAASLPLAAWLASDRRPALLAR